MEKLDPMFTTAIEEYPWESQEQKDGYLNFVQHLNKFGIQPTLPIDPVVSYFVQKDLESNEYWREMVGSQVSDLVNQIKSLQEETSNLKGFVEAYTSTIKSQGNALDILTQSLKKT